MNRFEGPMEPWPDLEKYSRTFHLGKNYTDLFFYDTGPAVSSTILMVHGLGDEADTWRYLLPDLATNHRVIAPDLPGFGRSTLPDQSLSPDYLISVLLELIQQVAEAPVILIGSSLGAVLCQEISLQRPELTKGLILVDGTILVGSQPLNMRLLLFLLPGLGEWLYTRLRRNPQAAYNTLQPYYADLDAMPEADRKFLYQRVNERVWSNNQRKAYFSTLRQLARWTPRQQKSLPMRLSACQVPTLAIWGEKDKMVAIDSADRLTDYQPSCRLVTIAEAGHLPHQERPHSVLQTLYDDHRLPIDPQ